MSISTQNSTTSVTTETIVEARDAAFAALAGGFDLVDLSETLGPDSVIWPGAPALQVTEAVQHDTDGYHARIVSTFEHAGTHFDAPEHFVPGGESAADISIDRLVLPVAVIDIREKAAADPNAVVEPADIEAFEAAHGPIRPGTAVVINSGWAARNADVLAYTGSETTEDLKFPGFGVPAAQLLVERGVVGLGVDTLGIDPGSEPLFPVHREVTHQAGLWHLENLVNVDQLLAQGAVLAVGVPRIAGGTGFPTRVFAFVPRT